MADKDLKTLAKEAGEELSALEEQLRLKLHLAGMEAKKLWKEQLQPELQKVSQRLDETVKDLGEEVDEAYHTSEAGLKLHLALAELRERYQQLEPDLRAIGARLRKQGVQAAAKLEERQAKLREKLEALGSDEAMQKRREQVQKALQEASESGRELAGRALSGLREAARRVREAVSGSESGQ